MASYLARVSLSYSYAEKIKDELGGQLLRLGAILKENRGAETVVYRFTYGVYKFGADSPGQAEAAVYDAWRLEYPDAANEIKVYVAEDNGDDKAALMKAVFSNFYGAEEYIALTAGLAREIPVLRERGALHALRMQNYLFAIDNGCGATTLTSSFANFLMRMEAFGKDSARRTLFSEYKVGKKTEGGSKSPDDIIESIDEQSEKENDSAAIGLDISCFLEDADAGELRAFIKRLEAYQDKYVFIFRVPFLEKRALDGIARTLSDLTLLRVVRIPPLHDCVLLEYLWDELRRLGYNAHASIMEPYLKKIREEKRDGRFYGYKTAEKVSNEIALLKASRDAEAAARGESAEKNLIQASDIEGLCEEDETKKTGYDALSELIGMEDIVKRVKEIVAQVKVSVKNERLDRPCIHMRFIGAPGTGKTTVARILGQIFREEGILRKGAFLEYSARSLCAEYVGQTAVRTAAVCREAYGSVLFIDEAYALYDNDERSNDYGREALTTLISEMENHRDDMLVIMAGYTDEMETLMKGNTGLRSRMPYAITFSNYTRKQLFEIFMLMVKKHFDYTEDLSKEASDYFDALSYAFLSSKDFANARFVRNLYERTWSKAALRASLAGEKDIKLTAEDFLLAASEKEFSEKTKSKNRIGF
ncbi:MAG: AAA family ATPase [Clostridia bacterium]|nr:AAA family ATPase [Clostridia bacterium]